MTDVAHDILGFIPESEKTSLGPISRTIPALTGAHYYPGYKDQLVRVLFLEAAYKGGPTFKEAVDRKGQPIFVKHERESETRYRRRQRLTNYRNYLGPIVDAYANYIMTSAPVRSKRDAFAEWCKNVDRQGRSLHDFMKHVLSKVVLIGRHWVGVDIPRAADGAVLTVQNDDRLPYLTSVSHGNVVDFEIDRTGKPTRLVIHHEIYSKKGFAAEGELRHEYHEWTAETLTVWRPVQKTGGKQDVGIVTGMPSTDGRVVSVPKPGYTLAPATPIAHGYGEVPFRCMSLFDGKGICEDIAEANKTILNLVGLLYEELYNQTFTQTYISGVSGDEADDVKFGTQTVIFLPNPEAGVHTAGANPEQARSIINALFNEVKEIHRMAHMEQSGEPLQKRVAEAASKKEKDSETMDQVLEVLAETLERFERDILTIVASFKTKAVTAEDTNVKYSRVFDTKTLREKISLIVELDKAPFMPPQIPKGMARMILEEVLEDGDDATEAIEWLEKATDSVSSQGMSALNLKAKVGVMGPVEFYKALIDPTKSDEEIRAALRQIKADREEFAPEQEEEVPNPGGPQSSSSGKPQGRPEKQPTPEDQRKKTEKQQAANQA